MLIDSQQHIVSACCGVAPKGNGDIDTAQLSVCPKCKDACVYVPVEEETKVKIFGREWELKDRTETQTLWMSRWICEDGDPAELYINNDETGFELYCFSGFYASNIFVYSIDFGTMWRKVYGETLYITNPISDYTYIQQCVTMADWFCSYYCEFVPTPNR